MGIDQIQLAKIRRYCPRFSSIRVKLEPGGVSAMFEQPESRFHS
jgi:hypothetical protein